MSNLPGLCAFRQVGAITDLRFRSELMKAKLQQLRFTGSISIDEDGSDLYNCQLVVSHEGCFLGAWSDELGCPTVYLKDLRIEDASELTRDERYTPAQHANHCTSTIMSNCEVVDICGVDIGDGLDFVLFVANAAGADFNHAQLIPRRYQTHTSPDLMFGMDAITRRFEFYNRLYCCAWNASTKSFAIGGCDGIFMRSLTDWRSPAQEINRDAHYIRVSNLHSYSLQFNSRGNTLLCGFSDGTIATVDIRCSTSSMETKTSIDNHITRIKLLADDFNLIASGQNNKLSLVDIRMNAVVFSYQGHVNQCHNIPFDCDESLDIICSPGQDNITRFWSLKQGQPLASLGPPEPNACQVYSSFAVKRQRICVYTFSKDKVFCYDTVNV